MDIEIAKEILKGIDIKFFLNGMTEQSNYIVDKADEINIAIDTVLSELEKKDKIIYEIAKSNVKLKGYDVEETYINNTISFYTKYIENLERNPHWRKE